MIEVEALTKRYGKVEALTKLSFRVEAGHVVGFLGPNGAGKSTTLRILTGFLGASSGKASVAGFDVRRMPIAAQRHFGYVPETTVLYPEMRVREYLGFRGELKGLSYRTRRAAIDRVLECTSTAEVADSVIRYLSKGFRQRVALADALIADPPLLILDEPTAGLDPNQVRQVRSLITQLAPRHTVLLSTHVLSEVEAVCDRAIVLNRGRKAAEGSLDELRQLRRPSGIRLKLRGPRQELGALMEHSRWVDHWGPSVRSQGGVPHVPEQESDDSTSWIDATWVTGAEAESSTEALLAELGQAGIGMLHVEPLLASLEEVFSSLTQHSQPAEGRST